MKSVEPMDPRVDPTAFVAAGVHMYGDVRIDSHAVVMFGVVIRAEFDRVEIGPYSNLQDNVVVHTDAGYPCLVGERVTVGHAAVVHGAKIGSHCLVGIAACALNGSELGEGAWLAAGAVLLEGRSIPPWTLAAGVPAKPIRELSAGEIERQRSGVDNYQQIAAMYKAVTPTSGP